MQLQKQKQKQLCTERQRRQKLQQRAFCCQRIAAPAGPLPLLCQRIAGGRWIKCAYTRYRAKLPVLLKGVDTTTGPRYSYTQLTVLQSYNTGTSTHVYYQYECYMKDGRSVVLEL